MASAWRSVISAARSITASICRTSLIEGLFARLDYIGIYLLIAGTVTPVALVVLRGKSRAGTLLGVWLLAATGVTLRVIPWELPRGFSNGLYLGMGWGVLICYWELARVLSQRALRLAVAGGIFYSVGAVLNWVRWPVLWPDVFSTHELFHLFVMAGTACHFFLMVKVIVPYERPVLAETIPAAANVAPPADRAADRAPVSASTGLTPAGRRLMS